jgi:hypothetical protein
LIGLINGCDKKVIDYLNFSLNKKVIMESRVICVLGMHRSGTSCLAGSLEEAGVYLGEVQRQNPYNLKGNCEHLKIVELHDDLFAASGGSWDDPPQKVVWSEKHKKMRDEIICKYNNVPLWGFKDPRALFTLDGWMEVLPEIMFVGTFRHPLAVACSLERRNKFTLEKGFQVWEAYNQRLLDYYTRQNFPVISFDLEEDAYRKKLTTLLPRLGLSLSADKFVFFEADLRHEQNEVITIPEEIRNLHERLLDIAI